MKRIKTTYVVAFLLSVASILLFLFFNHNAADAQGVQGQYGRYSTSGVSTDSSATASTSVGKRDKIIVTYKIKGCKHVDAPTIKLYDIDNNVVETMTAEFTGNMTTKTITGSTHVATKSQTYKLDNATTKQCTTCGATTSIKGSITKYSWIPEITINFNANGGSGGPTSKTITNSGNIPSSEPTRSGYIFMGWGTSPTYGSSPAIRYTPRKGSIGEAKYDPGVSITGTWTQEQYCSHLGLSDWGGDSRTLYAQWLKNFSSVRVDASGGTFSSLEEPFASALSEDGAYISVDRQEAGTVLTIPVPTRTGFTFTGYEYVANMKSTIVASGNTYKVTVANTYDDDILFMAKWSFNEAFITYDRNGGNDGELSMPKQTVSALFNIPIDEPKFRKNGYDFIGWNTKADGTGTMYQPGDEYKSVTSITLYAQWSQNSSVLRIDPAGGVYNGSSNYTDIVKPSSTSIAISEPTRNGYDFDGWDVPPGMNGTLTGSTYKFGDERDIVDIITARWKQKTYTITYNTGVNGYTFTQTKLSLSDIVISDAQTGKAGYKFVHWVDAKGNMYKMGDTYSTDADLSLTAVWGISDTNTSNTTKKAFDTDVELPNVKVTNITLKFSDATDTGVTVDYSSRTTNVAFDRWVPYDGETVGNRKYSDIKYGYMSSAANTLAQMKTTIGCEQCGTTNDIHFHGRLGNDCGIPPTTYNGTNNPTKTGYRHYDYIHNNLADNSYKWANNTGEHKSESRNSLAVARFTGDWKIQLPNAYKDGYVFVGWYVTTESGGKYGEYVGMAGDVVDLSTWARTFNTRGDDKSVNNITPIEIETAVNGNLSGITLHPKFEPIRYKILYVMNIPEDPDAKTQYSDTCTLQSHTLFPSEITAKSISGVHSLRQHGSDGKGTVTVGSTSPEASNYSYISSRTYIYDSDDAEHWQLEMMPITVNDYYFTGWTYEDILWTGYGGMNANGVTLGQTRIGNSISDTHDISEDYTLRMLSMTPNVAQNVFNNLPDTASIKGQYRNFYTVAGNRVALSPNPQTDATNTDVPNTVSNLGVSAPGARASGLNITNPTVYIVLKANWENEVPDLYKTVTYHSNNENESVVVSSSGVDAFEKLTDYINVRSINDSIFNSRAKFGNRTAETMVDSRNTAMGDTSDDGSYDRNATSDIFVTNKNSDKYYSGVSNGRNGFYSFQGWSTWKYATWRDVIDSNKKDSDNSELQLNCGWDTESIHSTFTPGAFTIRRYNELARSKRVGDLFYRMAGVLYPEPQVAFDVPNNSLDYDSGYQNNNAQGNMVSATGSGGMYSTTSSAKFWEAYKWRWTKGNTGHYAIPVKNVLDQGIHLYAIWDSYPTSTIKNIYCYKSQIETLTPQFLFSKVSVTDYEDFWNQHSNRIGRLVDADTGKDWNTIANADFNINGTKASDYAATEYSYEYRVAGSEYYMGGKFTATLVDYDFNRFKDAKAIDDVASVSVTYKFTDSAGNTTYKTAWVYIIDQTEENYDDEHYSGEPDNTRYSITRFISKENYDKAEFDEYGFYVNGSAREDEGSLMSRSKWYIKESHKDQLTDALFNLEELGNARLVFTLVDYDAINFKAFDPSDWNIGWRAVWANQDSNTTHSYHPVLNNDTGQWEYDYEAIKTKTEGIYVLDYEAITESKAFVNDNGLMTGNYDKTYEESVLDKYINEIFRRNQSNGEPVTVQQITN